MSPTDDPLATPELHALDQQLAALAAQPVDVPPWSDVVDRLDDRVRWSARRRVGVGIITALLVVPATAEAIEAAAPEAVRDTVIDRITDVLPWDNDVPVEPPSDAPGADAPATSRVPTPTSVERDRATTTTVPARREVDTTADRPSETRVDVDRPVAPSSTEIGGDDDAQGVGRDRDVPLPSTTVAASDRRRTGE